MDYNYIVPEEKQGRRIDLFLAEAMGSGYSRTFIQQLILQKHVSLNNRVVKPHHKINPGDKIIVDIQDEKKMLAASENIPLKIIYEDDDILVIDKPSGLVVHPAAGNKTGTLVNALLNYTQNLSTVNPQRPGIVHRLDKDTSGVMVVAKNNRAHYKLAKKFAVGGIKKKYAAIVNGIMEFDEGVIDLPIGRHRSDFRRQSVSFVNSKEAVTRYRVLKRSGDKTLVELAPQTGRTHQLRVHLAHLGHPILGDVKYGKEDFSRLALHAKELEFAHPVTGKEMRFSSPLPKEFRL